MKKPTISTVIFVLPVLLFIFNTGCQEAVKGKEELKKEKEVTTAAKQDSVLTKIDTADYDKRMLALSNNESTGK